MCPSAPDPAPPALSPLAAQAPLPHQRLKSCPLEPHRRQGAVRFRPQRVHIEHTLPAFYRVSTGHRHRSSAMIVWAESPVSASVVKTNTQPARPRLAAFGGPLF